MRPGQAAPDECVWAGLRTTPWDSASMRPGQAAPDECTISWGQALADIGLQ